MNLTNKKIQQMEHDLENLYDAIAGSDPDSNFYHTMTERIAIVQCQIATERLAIGDITWDGE